MFDAKTAWLTPPPLWNSSCNHARFAQADFLSSLTFGDIMRALVIICMSFGIVSANLMVICVLNSRRYARYISSQPRYLLTSLALNDLFIGVLVAPIALLPSLYKCWPYGEIFCQIQALLRGALSQQSAVILVCMAIDRYVCLLHPARYHRHSSKKGCVLVISITWVLSVALFAVLVLPRNGHYFNSSGLLACDPFHTRIAYRILSCCAYYFPTTMALMYCYGSGFHVNKLRLKNTDPPGMDQAGNMQCVKVAIARDYKLEAHERILSTSASRTMAAMSLGFIVVVTPATIQEVVAACTGCKVPPMLDFLVTWLALSNSFWNPFLYWLLNNNFRRISSELLAAGFCCRSPPAPPLEKSSGCCSSLSSEPPAPPHKPDLEGLSEKYWGEILERTVSSTSLHALQKVYHNHGPKRDSSLKCNGSIKNYNSDSIKSIHEYGGHPRHYEYQHRDFRHCNTGSDFRIDVYGNPVDCRPSDLRLFENHSELRFGEARSNLSLDEISLSKCNGHYTDS